MSQISAFGPLFAVNETTSAQDATNTTAPESFMQTYDTGTFLASLWTNMALVSLWFIGWILLRRGVKAVYEPRTYIPPREQQAPPLGTHLLKPVWEILKADPKEILKKNGVDPYVFVRFLRLNINALVPIWLVSWIVLMPVNALGGPSTSTLDMFAMSNAAQKYPKRYWAHLCLAYLFNGWIMFLLRAEMKEWLKIRQEWLVSPKHSRTAQASTVLITGIPPELMDEDKLAKLYSYLPGGVYRVWLQRDLKDMPSIWKRRTKACQGLENAQVSLIRAAHKRQDKLDDRINKLEAQKKPVPDELRKPANDGDDLAATEEYVPQALRPVIRLKPKWAPFGLGWLGVGEKVDAVTYYRKEIEECTIQLTEKRRQLERDILTPGNDADYYKPLSSAFICFNQQIAAHMAKEFLPYGEPDHMARRYIELAPDNVLWGNMGIRSVYELNLRFALSFLVTLGLIVAFIFPVVLSTFILPRAANTRIGSVWGVGSIAVKGTGFGSKLLLGLLTGLVPPILLMLILMIAPTLLRQLAKLHSFTKTEVELDVMNRYFAFLIIERFLIPTIATLLPEGDTTKVQWWPDFSGGAEKALTKAFEIQLPQASTFYITLLLLQVTAQFVQLFSPITLIIYNSKVILGGGTPRSFYNARYKMNHPAWGSDWPNLTAYFVILIVYMVIAPVINGFGAIMAVVSYQVYKYLHLWVLEQKPEMDTGGEFFPRAVTHVFVGMYIGEVALTIIFFGKGVETLPLAILMIILIIITVIFQYTLIVSYNPLLRALPLSLAHLTHGQPAQNGDVDEVKKPKSASNELDELTNNAPHSEEDAMWFGDNGKGGLQRKRSASVGSMRSWTQPKSQPRSRPRSRRHSSVGEKPAATHASPTAPGPPLPSPPVQGSSDDVEMRDLSVLRTTSVGDQPNGDLGEPLKSPISADTTTTDGTEDQEQHSQAPVLPRNRRRSSAAGAAGRRVSMAAPWQDHRHGRRTGPWEQRRPSVSDTEANQEDIRHYFARPGGPGVIRPREDSASPAAFFHPATHQPQPIVWLPADELGIARDQVARNRREGVKSTTKNAVFDGKNRVQVVGPAPDDR